MDDFLEKEVPESFYLSEEKTKSVIAHNEAHAGQICDRGGYAIPYCHGTTKTLKW